MGFADLAVGQQLAQQGGRALLPRMRSGVMDAGVERIRRAADRFETHGGGRVGSAPQRPGIRDEQRRQARLRLRAVHERQPLFGLERDRVRDAHVALTDHREREVRERREIARRTDAALRGHGRMDPPVQHLNEQLGEHRPHAARAAHQHVGSQQHHRAYGVLCQGLADTGRMAPNEIELQLATLLGRDAHVREFPETGIHAVHRFSALDRGFDGPARLLHSLERLRIEGNGHPVPRYSNDISDRKRLPVQRDSGGLRHGPKR